MISLSHPRSCWVRVESNKKFEEPLEDLLTPYGDGNVDRIAGFTAEVAEHSQAEHSMKTTVELTNPEFTPLLRRYAISGNPL